MNMCKGILGRYAAVAWRRWKLKPIYLLLLHLQRDALLLSCGIKPAQKAPLGSTSSKIIWQHHHLYNAVRHPVSERIHALC